MSALAARVFTTLLVAVVLLAGCQAAAPPTPQLTPTVAPTPTPFVGSGKIVFGTGYEDGTLLITGEQSTFKATVKEFAYSAELSEPAGATSLTFIIAKRSSAGSETQVYKTDVDISDPASVYLANKFDIAGLVGHQKGVYVLRFVRGGTVLAEGTFTLL